MINFSLGMREERLIRFQSAEVPTHPENEPRPTVSKSLDRLAKNVHDALTKDALIHGIAMPYDATVDCRDETGKLLSSSCFGFQFIVQNVAHGHFLRAGDQSYFVPKKEFRGTITVTAKDGKTRTWIVDGVPKPKDAATQEAPTVVKPPKAPIIEQKHQPKNLTFEKKNVINAFDVKSMVEWKSHVTVERRADGTVHRSDTNELLEPDSGGVYVIREKDQFHYFRISRNEKDYFSFFSCDASGKMLDEYKEKSLELVVANLKEKFKVAGMEIVDNILGKPDKEKGFHGRITWQPAPRSYEKKHNPPLGEARTYDVFPVTISIKDNGLVSYRTEHVADKQLHEMVYAHSDDLLASAIRARDWIAKQSLVRIQNGQEKADLEWKNRKNARKINYNKPILEFSRKVQGYAPSTKLNDERRTPINMHHNHIFEQLRLNDGYFGGYKEKTGREFFVYENDVYYTLDSDTELCKKMSQATANVAYLRIDGRFIEMRKREGTPWYHQIYVSMDGTVVCDRHGRLLNPIDPVKKLYAFTEAPPEREKGYFIIQKEIVQRQNADGTIEEVEVWLPKGL